MGPSNFASPLQVNLKPFWSAYVSLVVLLLGFPDRNEGFKSSGTSFRQRKPSPSFWNFRPIFVTLEETSFSAPPFPLGKPHRRRPSHDRHQAPGDVPDFYVSFRPSQPNTPPKKTLSKNTPTKNTLKIIPSPEKNTPQKIHQKNVVLLNCHSSLNSLNSHFPRRYHPKGPKGLIHLAPPVPLFKGVAITCSTSGGDTGW